MLDDPFLFLANVGVFSKTAIQDKTKRTDRVICVLKYVPGSVTQKEEAKFYVDGSLSQIKQKAQFIYSKFQRMVEEGWAVKSKEKIYARNFAVWSEIC